MARILVLTRHTPFPWDDGAGAYLFDVVSHLRSAGHRIHVVWLSPHDRIPWSVAWEIPERFARVATLSIPGAVRVGRRLVFPRYGLRLARKWASGRVLRALRALRLLPPPQPGPPAPPAPHKSWHGAATAVERVAARAAARRFRPQVVIANYAWMTELFPEDPGILRVCCQHDVVWRRTADLVAHIPGCAAEVPLPRETEAAWLSRAQIIVAITPADAAEFRTLAPDRRVVVAPMSGETVAQPDPAGQGVLFVGSDNQFNEEGIAWFLREVWPLVRATLPAARLDLCGSIQRVLRDVPPGVRVHGLVDDLTPYYRDAAVVVVPLRHATGMNIKLVEAAAHGRPIVTTPVTLRGAPFLRDAIAVADAPADFARAVIDLLASPARLAAAGQRVRAAASAGRTAAECHGELARAIEAGVA